MFGRKRDEQIDLIELSDEEIRKNNERIWGYNPSWRDETSITKEKKEINKMQLNEKSELDKKSRNEKNKKSKKTYVKKLLIRIAVCFITLVLILVIGLFGVVMILEYGPSTTARDLFVNSALETSAGKFLATTFVSAKEIEKITSENSIESSESVTDTTLITVASDDDEVTDSDFNDDDGDGIELVEINGGSYNGYLLKVKDPSRVMVGTCKTFGGSGLHVDAIVENYGAVAGVNGGGFVDENGMGSGGTPIGLVISNGELLYGELDKTYDIAGFDSNNILVVGSMTGQEALDRGIRDCCCYGPTLIVNGVATSVNGTGSGINPRTAIGQCADGTVLLLVIDGRQINSIGATYSDLIDVLLEYGAVNAYNLDGGSSTVLYYNGEYVNSIAPLTGSRLVPTAFIVK